LSGGEGNIFSGVFVDGKKQEDWRVKMGWMCFYKSREKDREESIYF
jgi:hypothetical protein